MLDQGKSVDSLLHAGNRRSESSADVRRIELLPDDRLYNTQIKENVVRELRREKRKSTLAQKKRNKDQQEGLSLVFEHVLTDIEENQISNLFLHVRGSADDRKVLAEYKGTMVGKIDFLRLKPNQPGTLSYLNDEIINFNFGHLELRHPDKIFLSSYFMNHLFLDDK